jgi:hypothetical protein
MAFYLCHTTFTGEVSPGVPKTLHAGVDILDSSKPAEAALLKTFGAFFSEVASTHYYPPPTEAELAAAKRAAKRKRAAKAKAAAAEAAVEEKSAEAAPKPAALTTLTSETPGGPIDAT